MDTARRPLGPTWHRLDSSVRETEQEVERMRGRARSETELLLLCGDNPKMKEILAKFMGALREHVARTAGRRAAA